MAAFLPAVILGSWLVKTDENFHECFPATSIIGKQPPPSPHLGLHNSISILLQPQIDEYKAHWLDIYMTSRMFTCFYFVSINPSVFIAPWTGNQNTNVASITSGVKISP